MALRETCIFITAKTARVPHGERQSLGDEGALRMATAEIRQRVAGSLQPREAAFALRPPPCRITMRRGEASLQAGYARALGVKVISNTIYRAFCGVCKESH